MLQKLKIEWISLLLVTVINCYLPICDKAMLQYYIVCRELPGNVTFSDGQNIGSVASYQCAHASGLQQIQCRETSGWSGALCGIKLIHTGVIDGHVCIVHLNDGLLQQWDLSITDL